MAFDEQRDRKAQIRDSIRGLPYRILELGDEKGMVCGKLLAELGAEVIMIESPGGNPARRIGPFVQDKPDEERSLFWFAHNINKKSITLNIEDADGKVLFKELVKGADVIVESFSPGYMRECQLGYEDLSQVNPGIIVVSISHFGQSGPYRDFKGSDLVIMSLGGFVYICGDPDRPPVRVSVEQAYSLAGAQAAMASLLALRYRNLTGEGQHVDVSVHECIPPTITIEIAFWEAERVIASRQGVKRRRGKTYVRDVWPCKDGHIGWRQMGGPIGAGTMRALVEWMDIEGMAQELKDVKWEAVDMTQVSQDQVERWEEVISTFFLKHTKAEIYDMALKKGMLLCPGYDVSELLKYQQLVDRNFWVEVNYPELAQTITHTGSFCKMEETPLKTWRRAPSIGEHNEEIYVEEMGLSPSDLMVLKQGGCI